MINITFLPDSDLDDVNEGIKDYENIWKSDGLLITASLENHSGYRFKETHINAIVYGMKTSRSHPLSLNSNLGHEVKKMTLVHELGHRVLMPPRRLKYKDAKEYPSSLDNHKVLFLFLYDAYESIYGKDFADSAVKRDSEQLNGLYKEAWDFALSFKTKEDRLKKFKELMV
ncbi:MAG: hypothetical protein KGI49_01925 [Patescibacteria group bacterium]|nr:hypothetical protein [Patescibacteria group bacterium]